MRHQAVKPVACSPGRLLPLPGRLWVQVQHQPVHVGVAVQVLKAHGAELTRFRLAGKKAQGIGLWDLWLWRAAVPLVTVKVLAGAQCGACLGRTA